MLVPGRSSGRRWGEERVEGCRAFPELGRGEEFSRRRIRISDWAGDGAVGITGWASGVREELCAGAGVVVPEYAGTAARRSHPRFGWTSFQRGGGGGDDGEKGLCEFCGYDLR